MIKERQYRCSHRLQSNVKKPNVTFVWGFRLSKRGAHNIIMPERPAKVLPRSLLSTTLLMMTVSTQKRNGGDDCRGK